MSRRWSVPVVMALIYVTMAFLGRASVIEGGTVALVWPAAGVGLVWLLQSSTRRQFWACLLTMSALLGMVMIATGSPARVTATAVTVSLVQTCACVILLRRWCPDLLGSGGSSSVHSVETLARGTSAAVLATALGAVIGGSGLAWQNGELQLLDYISWWTRNLTGMVVMGGLGHLVWEYASGRGIRPVVRPSVLERVALGLLSTGVYAYVFTQDGLPLAFLVIPLSVWASLRFPTAVAALHTVVLGSGAVALTLTGRGPFGDIARPEIEALVMQAFLLTSMLTSLAIGSVRDERSALLADLARSEHDANERAELLDAMTEAMTEGLAVVDAEGNIVRMNAACQELLAMTPQGVAANTHAYELRRPDGTVLPATEFPSNRAMVEGTVAAHDIHLRFVDGSVRILSVNAAALTGGDAPAPPVGALVVYRDVTRDRQDRSRLADFANTVAHDLRSPLTVIRGWLDLAVAQLGDLGDAADTRHSGQLHVVATGIGRAERASDKMATLISDLLSQASAEGRDLDLRPTELSGTGGVVAEVVELMPGHLQITVGDIPPVLVDEDLVHQLLANLVGNAVKYAAHERPLRVSVTGEQFHGRVRVDVTDNGVGVPADQRERVFDRFHRAHAGDLRFSGTGLGLAMCRTIVERHGGVIECLPASGGAGTTFRFDLPVAELGEIELTDPVTASSAIVAT